jgi:uncharacterized membrane protein
MDTIDYSRPKSPMEQWCETLSWLSLLLIFYITARHYADLPAQIPSHTNWRGEVDGWGSRQTVWLLPITSLLLLGLLSLAHKFPKMMNYPVRITPENAQRQFDLARTFLRVIKSAVLLLFLMLQWSILAMATGKGNLFSEPLVLPIVLVALALFPVVWYIILAFRNK